MIRSKRIRGRLVARDAMLFSSLQTLVKVAVASLIVGTILSHFGITADALLREAGVTPDRVYDYGRQGLGLGRAQRDAGRDRDRADLVSGLPVPTARRQQRVRPDSDQPARSIPVFGWQLRYSKYCSSAAATVTS